MGWKHAQIKEFVKEHKDLAKINFILMLKELMAYALNKNMVVILRVLAVIIVMEKDGAQMIKYV